MLELPEASLNACTLRRILLLRRKKIRPILALEPMDGKQVCPGIQDLVLEGTASETVLSSSSEREKDGVEERGV